MINEQALQHEFIRVAEGIWDILNKPEAVWGWVFLTEDLHWIRTSCN